jgi:teichuronic acid biosynthesis glycosyltransferase TuaG
MEKKKIEFSFTTYDIINSKNIIIEKIIANKNLKYNDLIKSCDLGLSTVILNRKLIDHKTKFANLKTKEDYVLWLKISKKKTLYALNQNLTKWRRLDSSLSSDTLQKLIDGFRVYRKYLKFSFFKSIFYLLILSYNYFLKRVI